MHNQSAVPTQHPQTLTHRVATPLPQNSHTLETEPVGKKSYQRMDIKSERDGANESAWCCLRQNTVFYAYYLALFIYINIIIMVLHNSGGLSSSTTALTNVTALHTYRTVLNHEHATSHINKHDRQSDEMRLCENAQLLSSLFNTSLLAIDTNNVANLLQRFKQKNVFSAMPTSIKEQFLKTISTDVSLASTVGLLLLSLCDSGSTSIHMSNRQTLCRYIQHSHKRVEQHNLAFRTSESKGSVNIHAITTGSVSNSKHNTGQHLDDDDNILIETHEPKDNESKEVILDRCLCCREQEDVIDDKVKPNLDGIIPMHMPSKKRREHTHDKATVLTDLIECKLCEPVRYTISDEHILYFDFARAKKATKSDISNKQHICVLSWTSATDDAKI